MIAFDPLNPFPLLPEGQHTYAEAQEHSALVDEWIGLRTGEVERSIEGKSAEGQQLWIGLPVQALLTPYTELRAVLARLEPQKGETVVDLGAAYGRMGWVIDAHYPGTSFIGYEYVGARVSEGERCFRSRGIESARLYEADLSRSDFKPNGAEYYFLYDYGSREAIEKTLRDLKEIAKTRPITVVGRGRASRDAIERSHPWLSQVVAPEHFDHYSIYRSHDKAARGL